MKTVRDTWLVFGRYLSIFLHNPVWVVIGVVQPALYLVLFAPLLQSIADGPGFPRGGAYNVFVPGLLIQLSLFGASGVGFSLIAELRLGVVERMRVTPVSRVSLMLGRAMRDILTLVVQATILIVVAIPFGMTLHPLGALLGIVLVALIGLTTASIAYALALWLKSEDAYAPLVFTATLPLLLLSGVLLPLTLAPAWLRTLSALNPLAYAVDASRALFTGNVGDPSVVMAALVLVPLAIVSVLIAARSFGRAVA